jgi:hypothetical protein
MNRNLPIVIVVALFASAILAVGQTITDPAYIEVYVHAVL